MPAPATVAGLVAALAAADMSIVGVSAVVLFVQLYESTSQLMLPCPALPCPALPCPALTLPYPEGQNQLCLRCTRQQVHIMTQHNSNTSSKIEECTTPSAKQTITTARATRSGHFCRVRRKCPSGRTAGSLCAGVSQKPRGPWPPPTLCPPLSSASICPGRFCQPWNVKTLTHSHAASSAVHAACCAVLCCAVLCCAVLCRSRLVH